MTRQWDPSPTRSHKPLQPMHCRTTWPKRPYPPPSPPSVSPTLQAGGKKFEVGEAGRRCGGKGPMDCASFDSDRLLPKSAFEDTRVGRRIRFFNLRGTWGGEQGALVQLLPIYVAYRTPPQA